MHEWPFFIAFFVDQFNFKEHYVIRTRWYLCLTATGHLNRSNRLFVFRLTEC